MAKKKEDNKKYDIVITQYVKSPTGEKYGADVKPTYLVGKRKYGKAVKKSETTKKTTWGALKQDAFNKSKDKKLSVKWGKPRLIRTTQELSNGDKVITYFKPGKKK